MTVVRSSRLAATAAAATLLAVTGCTDGRTAAEPRPTASTSSVSPDSAASRPTATRPTSTEPSPGTATGAPSPGSLAVPDTTAGSLSRASFPTPRRLGVGWRYSVDPGDAEEGYAGNGTPALERSPEEIVQTTVPFGCDRASAMPAPTYALEVDYTFRGTKAIAVRGQFRDRAEARAFFAGRSENLRACRGRSGSTAIGPLVRSVTSPAADALTSDRTPDSDPWHELAVLDDATVALLAVHGADRFTDPQTRRLVALFRR